MFKFLSGLLRKAETQPQRDLTAEELATLVERIGYRRGGSTQAQPAQDSSIDARDIVIHANANLGVFLD